ncbi:MAG: alcohol acetyltransferase [Firmicutes bacterium]|nr:alcohol acetyltransferase [Bacillota bacterium]
MKKKKWVRLDNASNIFLAAMTDVDTKVFRFSAAVEEAVDPVLLQQALDKAYDQYALYHSVLRRGFFWYYLEESDLHPVVTLDDRPPCSKLYHFDRKELLFRVSYYQNRIHLEVFHALSDGTGALWFFEDLLSEYVMLRYPGDFQGMKVEEIDILKQQLEDDSYAHHFRNEKQRNFNVAAQSAIKTVTKAGIAAARYGKKATYYVLAVDEPGHKPERVYKVRGKKTSDNRTHVIEMDMPVKEVLQLAKGQHTSLTVYMTALFIDAVYRTKQKKRPEQTIAVSVPVNLRQFYPSESARNFFATTRLEYTYGAGDDSLASICESLDKQLKGQLSHESLGEKLNRLIAFEYNPFIRVIIRPVKDLVLRIINYFNNQNLTLAISNVGRVSFPEPIDKHIQQLYLQTSAVRPQFCAISHGGRLAVCFTSPFVETNIQDAFARSLTDAGVPVTVAANKVTSDELGGGKGKAAEGSSPFPDIPLRFIKGQVIKILVLASFGIIALAFIAEALWLGETERLRLAVFGVASMWLVVLIIIRKRRNIAKGIVYLIVSLSLISVYWDYLNGWQGWSTTYFVPIICSSAIIAMFIAVRVVKLEAGDYVPYLLVAALLGLIPALFLALGLVEQVIPSAVSLGLSSVMLILTMAFRRRLVLRELEKRFHI